MQVLHDGLSDSKYRPCPLLVKYVEAGWFGPQDRAAASTTTSRTRPSRPAEPVTEPSHTPGRPVRYRGASVSERTHGTARGGTPPGDDPSGRPRAGRSVRPRSLERRRRGAREQVRPGRLVHDPHPGRHRHAARPGHQARDHGRRHQPRHLHPPPRGPDPGPQAADRRAAHGRGADRPDRGRAYPGRAPRRRVPRCPRRRHGLPEAAADLRLRPRQRVRRPPLAARRPARCTSPST